MSKFKVGDRVAVYSGKDRETGKISQISSPGFLWVILDRNEKNYLVDTPIVHPKQCRLLKPKAKLREFWIEMRRDGEPRVWFNDPHCTFALHVREVRKTRPKESRK